MSFRQLNVKFTDIMLFLIFPDCLFLMSVGSLVVPLFHFYCCFSPLSLSFSLSPLSPSLLARDLSLLFIFSKNWFQTALTAGGRLWQLLFSTLQGQSRPQALASPLLSLCSLSRFLAVLLAHHTFSQLCPCACVVP